MYSKIYNPILNNNYPINSKIGKYILYYYLNQLGGAGIIPKENPFSVLPVDYDNTEKRSNRKKKKKKKRNIDKGNIDKCLIELDKKCKDYETPEGTCSSEYFNRENILQKNCISLFDDSDIEKNQRDLKDLMDIDRLYCRSSRIGLGCIDPYKKLSLSKKITLQDISLDYIKNFLEDRNDRNFCENTAVQHARLLKWKQRGLDTLGNFWKDLLRKSPIYIINAHGGVFMNKKMKLELMYSNFFSPYHNHNKQLLYTIKIRDNIQLYTNPNTGENVEISPDNKEYYLADSTIQKLNQLYTEGIFQKEDGTIINEKHPDFIYETQKFILNSKQMVNRFLNSGIIPSSFVVPKGVQIIQFSRYNKNIYRNQKLSRKLIKSAQNPYDTQIFNNDGVTISDEYNKIIDEVIRNILNWLKAKLPKFLFDDKYEFKYMSEKLNKLLKEDKFNYCPKLFREGDTINNQSLDFNDHNGALKMEFENTIDNFNDVKRCGEYMSNWLEENFERITKRDIICLSSSKMLPLNTNIGNTIKPTLYQNERTNSKQKEEQKIISIPIVYLEFPDYNNINLYDISSAFYKTTVDEVISIIKEYHSIKVDKKILKYMLNLLPYGNDFFNPDSSFQEDFYKYTKNSKIYTYRDFLKDIGEQIISLHDLSEILETEISLYIPYYENNTFTISYRLENLQTSSGEEIHREIDSIPKEQLLFESILLFIFPIINDFFNSCLHNKSTKISEKFSEKDISYSELVFFGPQRHMRDWAFQDEEYTPTTNYLSKKDFMKSIESKECELRYNPKNEEHGIESHFIQIVNSDTLNVSNYNPSVKRYGNLLCNIKLTFFVDSLESFEETLKNFGVPYTNRYESPINSEFPNSHSYVENYCINQKHNEFGLTKLQQENEAQETTLQEIINIKGPGTYYVDACKGEDDEGTYWHTIMSNILPMEPHDVDFLMNLIFGNAREKLMRNRSNQNIVF